MKRQPMIVPKGRREIPVSVVDAPKLFDRCKDKLKAVAARAYQLFENNGRENGHDVENWLEAEAEFFRPAKVSVVIKENGVLEMQLLKSGVAQQTTYTARRVAA